VTSPEPKTSDTPAPRKILSVFNVTMIAVGIVIGAGIFKTPSLVAELSGSVPAMFAAWIAGGVLTLIGALCYAELASAYPSTGGDYAFLTRAFGRNFSFFFGWARATVICPGSIALLGFALGDYLTRIANLGAYSSAIYAAFAVCILTAINFAGLKQSARMQNVLTLCEIGGVLLVAAAAFTIEPNAAAATTSSATEMGMFGAAMVFVLLTFGGWNDVAYVSAEVRGGSRSILRALILSVTIITVVYLLFIAAALHSLGFEGLKTSQAVGADIMQASFGIVGIQAIGFIVAVTALTSMNGTMIVGARVNHALGNDWRAFGFMREWHDERNTPAQGLLVQAAISLALIALGTLEKDGFAVMVEFTAPVFWFFFMMSGIALFMLRFKEPTTLRPFRVPLYPVLPAVFVGTCAYLLYSSFAYAQSQKAGYVALSVMLGGALVWLLARMKNKSH
jgi:APA family basic amino acid/polyamine antiporter